MTSKPLLLGCLLAALAGPANAASMLFTAFNADEDGWAMVTLEDITAGTTVYFTDNEWNGSAIGSGGAFNAGESYFQWLSGSTTIAAGTVIRFSSVDVATRASSVGTLTGATVAGNTNYGLSTTSDTLYAYLGSSATAPTQFLAAISNTTFAADGPLGGTGLAVGVDAVQLGNGGDFAQYTGTRSGQSTFAGYKSGVANLANWNNPGDGTFDTTAPNVTAFTVVPEPSAALLGGVGLLGLLRRRR